MLYIAICDDELVSREKTKGYIIRYFDSIQMDYKIDTFSSGVEFVSLGMGITKYQIVFLDINMGELNGIQTAKRIREVNEEMFIVFVTAYIGYSLEGYKVKAIRYLLKENANFQNALTECLETIIEAMEHNVLKKNFDFMEGAKKIALERILYIESKLHKLEFTIMEQEPVTYSLYGKLNEMENVLSEHCFVRIHQSYLVNLRYLRKVTGYKAIMNNGMQFTIPKARYKYVKELFIAYKGEI